MVLHKNKWDRKATRAHVKKLKAQGKEDDTKKPKVGKGEGVTTKQDFPKLPNAVGSEGEDEDEEDDEGLEEGEEYGGGQFSKRKMQDNAWRYGQEEEPAPGGEEDEPEPEPDYVCMTIQRKSQLQDPEEAFMGDLDEEFLKGSLQAQRSLGARGGVYKGNVKGKVVKVDRKQFADVTTKIAKQSSADVFRERFAPRKAKSRVAGSGGTGDDVLDDVDSFLKELNIDEATAAGSREISGGLCRSRTSGAYGHDKGDDWLDSMLGGR